MSPEQRLRRTLALNSLFSIVAERIHNGTMAAQPDPAHVLNTVSLGQSFNDESPTRSPAKRKCTESTANRRPPKRVRTQAGSPKLSDKGDLGPTPTVRIRGKLGRPRKNTRARQTTNPQRKGKGDTYEVPDDDLETAAEKPTVRNLRQRGPKLNGKLGAARSSGAKAREQVTARRTRSKNPEYASLLPPESLAESSKTSQVSKTRSSKKNSGGAPDMSGRQGEVDGHSKNHVVMTGAQGTLEDGNHDSDEDNQVGDETARIQGGGVDADQIQFTGERRDIVSNDDAAEADGANEREQSSQTDDGNPRPAKRDELLGQDGSWEKIWESARANRKNEQIDVEKLTSTMGELHDNIKKVQRLYKRIASNDGNAHDAAHAKHQLTECLEGIEDMINRLPREKPADNAREMVRDAYIDVIPEFIVLLSRAMERHVRKSSKSAYNLEGIMEVVRVQRLVLRLCDEVFAWNVKPVTDNPIIRNIKLKVYPCLKSMNKNFQVQLEAKELQQARRQDRAKAAAGKERREPLKEQEQEEVESRIETRWADSLEAEKRKAFPRALLARLKGRHDVGSLQLSSQSPQKKAWTSEEDIALKMELVSNAKANKLPRMYSTYLNSKLNLLTWLQLTNVILRS